MANELEQLRLEAEQLKNQIRVSQAIGNVRIYQLCIEPPSSALNMKLPAFAAERRRPQHGACSCRSVCLLTGRLATNPPGAVAAVDRWDRQTDGRTPDRHIDPAPHTMRAVSVMAICYSNGNDWPHRSCRTDRSVVFAMWRQCGSLGARESAIPVSFILTQPA